MKFKSAKIKKETRAQLSAAGDRQSLANIRMNKINQKWFSPLMYSILICIGEGIERGELIERLYGLERRYCHWYTDPCLRGKAKRDYEQRYRKAQPALSRSLRRLEKRGLVTLVRKNKYVKAVSLTVKGQVVVSQLKEQVTNQ